MIPAFLKQVFYVAEKRSWAYIARETLIPYRQVLRLRQGPVSLASELVNNIRNLYRREAYSRLRDVGFSYHQARRFSTYAVEAVRLHTQQMRLKIADLATGATAAKIRQAERQGVFLDLDTTYDEMYAKVQEGIKSSPEPAERIYDY